MTTTTSARHRKAARPITPMSSVAPAARRGFAVAASSGLALTMLASGANAADSTPAAQSAGALGASGVGAIAAEARNAVATNEAISTGDAEALADVSAVAEVSVAAPAAAPAAQETTTQTETRTQASQTAQSAKAAKATVTTVEVPASAAGSTIASIAMQYVGVPYVFGGSTPAGWDCSGFVAYVYAQAGISLPHSSYGQGGAGTLVSAAEAQPGDIVYYGSHVGIYMGNGMMIDAGTPRTGTVYRAVYGTPIGYVRVG